MMERCMTIIPDTSCRHPCDDPIDAAAHTPAEILYPLLATSASSWLLAYYAIPNTIFARISPGGIVMELNETRAATQVGVASLLLFVVAIVLTMAASRRTSAESKCPPLWLLTLAFVVPLVAVCMEKPASTHRVEAISILTAISVGLLAAWLPRGRCIAALSIVAATQAAFAIIYQREQVNQLLSGTIHRAGGTFNQPNHLYTLMIVALPFSMAGALTSRGAFKQFAYLAAASAELTALILSYSRAGIVAAAISLAILACSVMPGRIIRSIIAVILLTVCTIVITVRTYGPVNAISARGANMARLRQWDAGWKAFAAHPITGVGVSNFTLQVEQKSTEGAIVNVVNEPKSIFISWLAERGLAGGALFAMFVISIVIAVRWSSPSIIGAAIAAAWISLLAAGMVDTLIGPANRYVGNCVFGMLIGMTSMLRRSPETTPYIDAGTEERLAVKNQ